MPRFVLLYHKCPPEYERPSHWDLMLEVGEKLHTWALPRLPHGWESARMKTAADFASCAAVSDDTSVVATPLANHRIDYLHKEGPLSGNRGEVRRIDAGTYETISENSRLWHVAVYGDVIHGEITLQDFKLTL